MTNGLIPAHAGKTRCRRASWRLTTAHPRSRGENQPEPGCEIALGGSSPLTRGKRCSQRPAPQNTRLIPAHAGKTFLSQFLSFLPRAHPRSRGENGGRVAGLRGVRGSSPLTRGKPTPCTSQQRRPGLIPAHAGKTKLPGQKT